MLLEAGSLMAVGVRGPETGGQAVTRTSWEGRCDCRDGERDQTGRLGARPRRPGVEQTSGGGTGGQPRGVSEFAQIKKPRSRARAVVRGPERKPCALAQEAA